MYELLAPADRPLVAPVVVAALDGWIDAAGAATTAIEHLASEGELLARFDPDALFDYRARRPTLDIVDGALRELTWPELNLRRVRADERDLLVLLGPEPDYRWRELGGSVAELVLRLGIVEWVSTGAIPAAVPHTRPVHIIATQSQDGLLRDEERPFEGVLRVPSAALSVIELAVSEHGIPAVGFYAQIPHYLGGPFAAASIALLERLERHLGVPVPVGDLPDEAAQQRGRLEEALAERPETREYVRQLEEVAEDEVPSADEIAAEIERFLQQQPGGEGEGRLGGE